jgi:hypothetical protein
MCVTPCLVFVDFALRYQILYNYIYIVMPIELFVSSAGDLTTVWKTDGGRVPSPVTPWPLMFLFTWPWAIEHFSCPGDSLTLWPNGVLERLCWWQDVESGMLAIRTHTRRDRKCIAGLRFVLIPQPCPWTGYSHPNPLE